MPDETTVSPSRRARGDGALYLKGGVYMARLYLPALGKHRKRSTGTTDLRKAERCLARWKAEVYGGTWVPNVDKTTFESLATMLLDDYRANGRSLNRPEDAIAHLRGVFGPSRARAITTDRVLRYRVVRQEEGAANGTINRELAALKRMFRLGVIAEQGGPAPAHPDAPRGQRPEGLLRGAGFPAVPGAPVRADLQPLADVGYLTGWRVQDELLTRQWAHVDFEHGWLRLEPGETKNGEGRMYPLTPRLRAVLEHQRDRRAPSSGPRAASSRGCSTAMGCPIRDFEGRGSAPAGWRACPARSRTTSAGPRSGTSSAPASRGPRP